MPSELTYESLKAAVAGSAAAFRSVTELQPAGGPGDKVFPPTYEGGKYVVEKRRVPGKDEPVDCVLLDSVQSQANRMELALLEAWRKALLPLPVITVDFADKGLEKVLKVTSLETPHRIADALLRDSYLDGVPFRKAGKGRLLDSVDNKNATALFELCPTALVFGMWDSTGPKGGLGAKFARAMVSEIVGLEVTEGFKTSSRIDPAQILKSAGPVFRTGDGQMTVQEKEAKQQQSKAVLYGRDSKGRDVLWDPKKDQDEGRPSTANHGNVTPTIERGGVTFSKAIQTTVLSLAALRRLSFPLDGTNNGNQAHIDAVARTTLAALGLCAATLASEDGDLRSRCQLFPLQAFIWDLLDEPGQNPKSFSLSRDGAIALYKTARDSAREAGLPWLEEELILKPSPALAELVRRSQQLTAQGAVEPVST